MKLLKQLLVTPIALVLLAPVAASAGSVNYQAKSYQGQQISDYKVGEILGEVKCRNRPVNESIDYLTVMGITGNMLKNIAGTANARQGYRNKTMWC